VATALADMGYADHDDIATLATREQKPVTTYVPLPEERSNVKPATLKERERKRTKDPEAIKDWRKSIAAEEAKTIMKKRVGIERVNAQVKRRGLARVKVRGLANAHTIALWDALANNLTAGLRLGIVATAAVDDAATTPAVTVA
jgi:Transposase DDE domain